MLNLCRFPERTGSWMKIFPRFCAKSWRMRRSSLAHSWNAKFGGNFSPLASIDSKRLSYKRCITSNLSSGPSNSTPSSPMASSWGRPSQARKASVNFSTKGSLMSAQPSVIPTSRKIFLRLWRRNSGSWSPTGGAFSRKEGLVADKNNFRSSTLTGGVENVTSLNLNLPPLDFSKHFLMDSALDSLSAENYLWNSLIRGRRFTLKCVSTVSWLQGMLIVLLLSVG